MKFSAARRSFLFIAGIILQAFTPVFSQQIINPSPGKWANRQVLVIDTQTGENAYYSLNGENPETSGFAYDGPVLLDVDGNVRLNVIVVKNDGLKYSATVNYSVESAELPYDEKASAFIQKISDSTVYDYSAGSVLQLPESMEYSFGAPSENYEQGTGLSVSSECVVSRYVPCTLTDGKTFWRFVIKIHPVIAGSFSRKDVPFEVSDWTNINFTDLKLLYKLDDEYWMQKKTSCVLDRSENHMISWQNIDYSAENPVNYFVLPVQPALDISKDSKGMTVVKFKEGTPEGFKFGVIAEDGSYGELYDVVSIDTFQGDAYKGKVTLGIFYDSVYQGKKEIEYNVYKKIPPKPKFISSSSNYVSRKPVNLKIEAKGAREIYYSLRGPVVLQNENYKDSQSALLNLQDSSFKKYTQPLTLKASMDGACLYKITAYSVDAKNQKSREAEYSVVVDQTNYYVNPDSTENICDGSEKYPFKSFSYCIPYMAQTRFASINISGDVYLPAGNTMITTNCQITGTENSRLIFPKNSSLTVRNSSLVIKDCIIEHQGFTGKVSSEGVFTVDYGVLDFTDCEILIPFLKSGMFIKAEKSVLNMNKTGVSVTAQTYASVAAAVGSKIYIKDSRLSGAAETSVLLSVQGGLFELSGSSCRIQGSLGRIAELFDSQSTIRNNLFSADLSKPAGSIKAVYMDSKNVSIEDSNNQENGF